MMLGAIAFLVLAFNDPQTLGPGDYLHKLEVESRQRSFWVHVPPTYDGKKPMPVVLALHGATMTAKIMEELTDLNAKADDANFIVVYPNGTGPNPLLYTWNSGGFAGFLALGKPNDVRFIGRVLDEVETMFRVDKKRVYATGISNGAMMCYRLAAELSDRIAAIAPVSGTIAVESYQPKRPVPVLHIHGTADLLVPYQGPSPRVASFMKFLPVEETIALCVKVNHCAAQPETTELPNLKDQYKVTRKIYKPRCDGAEVNLYVIDGGGHTWPGRPIGGGILGTYTMNLDANDVIWEFFARHVHK